MQRRVITALGVLVAIAGSASSVCAQSTLAANSETSDVTLSGESLVGITRRTVEDDFNRFFVDDSQNFLLSRNDSTYADGVNWQIAEGVQVVADKPLLPPIDPLSFPQNDPFSDAERVEVQIELE
ncbi:MAG TPA: hypothetical protein DDZ80_01890 [Cyanobacteria bacterium UBA8803]|nr:hypothetical protein [Cyanobacteria bacterium UBA9273]HBL57346.1 hypothetical protein [Cyanobacteria bacterium UBA8803]